RSTSIREIAFQLENSTFVRRTPLAQTTSIRRPEKFKAINSPSKALNARAPLRNFAAGLHRADAIAETIAAKRIAFGAPIQFSSGTIARHASAPPIRSAP